MLYTAFDFLVTAYSLVEKWEKKRHTLMQTEVDALYAPMLIKISQGDLANGGKRSIDEAGENTRNHAGGRTRV